MDKVNVLGVEFDNVTMEEAVERCNKYITSDRLNMVVTPNPEIVMLAKNDKEYIKIINEAALVVPDGIGIVKAAKILKRPLKQRVAGYDLICSFFENNNLDIEKRVYILGAKPGVANLAKLELEKKYRIKVVGTHDGYFEQKDVENIIEDINKSKANILLVGMGMKKQEQFIYENKEKLDVNIAFGCGGSIDVFAKIVKRAPKFWVNHNLEWLYRLLKQPSRLGRMLVLPKFLLLVMFTKNKI